MIKKIFLGIGLLIVLGLGAIIAYYFITISAESKNTESVTVYIEIGEGINEVAAKLKEKDLIRSALTFKFYMFTTGEYTEIQPGKYNFEQVSSKAIAEVITPVPIAKDELEIKIIEGWSSVEIGEYLEEQGIFSIQEFLNLTQTTDTREIIPDAQFSFLKDKPATQGLEGYLFPDTYRVYTDITGPELIEKMLANFDIKLNQELRDEIAAQGKTIFEIITLASIIEHEVRQKEEREIAAGIFWKRLEIGKRLESDATINYVTGKNTTMPSFEDLEVDSKYNTYRNDGLPPGPICSPSLDSIKAVIYPQESDYLFFLTKPDGTAVFSHTYEEHLENKSKFYPE